MVQKLLRKVRKGARVVFVPGNHDEFARDFLDLEFGGVEVIDQVVHETADGKKLLVIHGDQYDIVVSHARWLAHLGDWAYDFAIWTNSWFNRARRKLGMPYWSFSKWAKLKVKKAVNFIGDFERTLAAEARKRGVDGVICGHIHHATIRDIDGVIYVNTGDFVEILHRHRRTFRRQAGAGPLEPARTRARAGRGDSPARGRESRRLSRSPKKSRSAA